MSSKAKCKFRFITHALCGASVGFLFIASAAAAPGSHEGNPSDPDAVLSQPSANLAAGNQSEIDELKSQLVQQQKPIDELQATLQKLIKLSKDSRATAAQGRSRWRLPTQELQAK